MFYILRRLKHALTPRILEGFVVWKVRVVEPDETGFDGHPFSYDTFEFAWPSQSMADVEAKVRKNLGAKHALLTLERVPYDRNFLLFQLPLMASGPLHYQTYEADRRSCITNAWSARHATWLINMHVRLSNLTTHMHTQPADRANLMGLREQIRWALTDIMCIIEPPGVEWSENPLAWPHACDQGGCSMHKSGMYCSGQSKWCKLARYLRPLLQRKIDKAQREREARWALEKAAS